MSQPVVDLVHLLPPKHRADMLEAAWLCALQVGGFVAEDEFIKLLPALPEAASNQGFQRLLEEAERLSHHRQQSWSNGPQESDNSSALADTLERLAPHLPDALIPMTIDAVVRMTDRRWRSIALCHLLPRFGDSEREAVLAEIATLAPEAAPDEQLRAAACRGLARAVPVLEGDLQASLRIRLRETLRGLDPSWIPGLLRVVAAALDQADVEALAERAAVRPNLFTPLALSGVAAPPRKWSLCLDSLKGLKLGRSKDPTINDLLHSTVEALLEAPDEIRLLAWKSACEWLRGDRGVVALHLTTLAPLAASIQRGAILGAAARSLLTVQRWWP
jgi:hypothetical protein